MADKQQAPKNDAIEGVLVDLTDLSLDDLRTQRRTAEQEEQELSFVRRLLHGRIDIIKAELRRRAGHGDDLISSLPSILADGPAGGKPQGRHVSLDDKVEINAAAIAAKHVVNNMAINNLPELSDRQLREALSDLQSHERAVSDARSQVHRKIDRMSAELTKRYREGTAQVDDLLAAARRH